MPFSSRLAAPPGRLVDVGGHRLHLRSEGEGTPAVAFDAALGGSSLSWSLVAPGVAAVTRACTYDRGGFGWSDGGPLPRTAGRIAGELYGLLLNAGVPPPWILVGHSYGALVMQLIAARHSNCVAGLVLLEPADPDEWMHPSDVQRQQIARGTKLCRHGVQAARLGVARVLTALVNVGAIGAAWTVVKLVSRGGLGRADEQILAPVWKLPPATRGVLKHMWTQPKFFEALGSQIASISESAGEVLREAPGHFGNLPLIVLTAAGAQERRMRADAALAARSTRGRHVLVPDSGHWIPLDAPDAVVRVVTDLVNEIRAGLPEA